MPNDKRQSLLDSLSRGLVYAVPVVALVAGGSALTAIYSDVATESGYHMMVEAEAEAEAEAEGEAEGEAESEVEG